MASLRRMRNIGASLLIRFILLCEREYRCLQTAETEIQVAAVQHRARQLKTSGCAALCQFCQQCPARIIQTQ